MHRSWPLFVASLLALVGLPSATEGDAQVTSGERQSAGATRALEIARLRLWLYERVDYPLRLQELDGLIRLKRAEIGSLQRRVAEYERFDGTKALFITLENTRLQLLEAELALKNLEQERLLLQLYFKDERRLRQLEIEEAQARARLLRSP